MILSVHVKIRVKSILCMVLTTSLRKEQFWAHIMTMQCIAWTSSPQPPLTLSNPLQDDWLRSTSHSSQARSGFDSGEVAQFYLLIIWLMQCVCGEHRPNCLIQVASLVWLLLFRIIWQVITRKGNCRKAQVVSHNNTFYYAAIKPTGPAWLFNKTSWSYTWSRFIL